MAEKHEVDNNELECEVVELEGEDGQTIEFAILGSTKIDKHEFAFMATMEDIEEMDSLTEEEFDQMASDAGLVVVMRIEGEQYFELTDDEYEKYGQHLEAELEKIVEQQMED